MMPCTMSGDTITQRIEQRVGYFTSVTYFP